MRVDGTVPATAAAPYRAPAQGRHPRTSPPWGTGSAPVRTPAAAIRRTAKPPRRH